MNDNNQNIKLNSKEALEKLEDIFKNIQENIKSLNGFFILKLQEEIKNNDLSIYNEIKESKKLERDDEILKLLFLENVGFEVSKLEKEIIQKDKFYCQTITNLRGLKRVILAKIKQEDLNSILTIHDFNYYEDKVIDNLNHIKDLIYNKIKCLRSNISIDLIQCDKLNNCYLTIINDLTSLKGIFLSEIINNERRALKC